MFTLNCKALFKTSFLLFVKAIGIYLLLTLPTLVFPVMYLMSAAFALSFGWAAGILFLCLLFIIRKIAVSTRTKMILLYAAVPLGILPAFQMIEIMNAWQHIWQSGGFLLFPAAAVISGWISLLISKSAIKNLFEPEDILDEFLTPENI